MKKFLKSIVLMAAFLFLVVGVKQTVLAADYVELNAENFPDKNFRESLSDYAYSLDDEDDDDDDYDEDDDDYDEDDDDDGFFTDDDDSTDLVSSYVSTAASTAILSADTYSEEELEAGKTYINVKQVIYLSLSSKIKNLKGIELLTEVKDLGVYNYQGTSMDLSANKKLTSLYITGKKLKTLKVAEPSKIQTMSLGCPNLNVDFKNFMSLKLLTITDTDKTNLDFSSVKNVQELYIYGGKKLTSIKVGSNVRYFAVWGCKKLTKVDVTKAKKLSRCEVVLCKLENIDLSKNKNLIALDVKGNKSLKKLNISNNRKLSIINVGETALSTLDTSKNSKLTSLAVYDTKISSLNLKNNKKLSYLDYSGSKVKDVALGEIYKNKTLSISYDYVKKGSTLDFKNVFGTGYKVEYLSGDGATYDSAKGSFKIAKKSKNGYASVKLTKGKTIFYIYLYYT